MMFGYVWYLWYDKRFQERLKQPGGFTQPGYVKIAMENGPVEIVDLPH